MSEKYMKTAGELPMYTNMSDKYIDANISDKYMKAAGELAIRINTSVSDRFSTISKYIDLTKLN